METIDLIPPTTALHDSWLRSRTEWGTDEQDGASVFLAQKFGWDLQRSDGFGRWVRLLNNLASQDFTPPSGFVRQTTWWLRRGADYLGAVSLRHELGNEFLREVGGHIGYGLRPSARGRGLAKTALAGALVGARRLGLPRVLLTCSDSNAASARTIEACGGELERIIDRREAGERFGTEDAVRRYWITLPDES